MNVYDSAMIDLETMSLRPNAAIVQIGCVGFNSYTGEVAPDPLLVDVDLQSAIELGGVVDESTVRWWVEIRGLQLPTFCKIFTQEKKRLTVSQALDRLDMFLGTFPDLQRCWALGPSFDISILERYYDRLNRPIPWAYNFPRDVRTAYDFAADRGWVKKSEPKNTHQATEDCLAQIHHLVDALNWIRNSRR